MRDLLQAWPRPARPRPIVIIGAGGIVRTAHLPAYRRVGFPIAGLFDIDLDRARATAQEFGVERVYASLDEALAHAASVGSSGSSGGSFASFASFDSFPFVFDVAIPGDQVLGILESLPAKSAVLIQKPMGPDLAAARRILATCETRQLTAAINFQLRFSPNVIALRDLLSRGALGTLVDVDVRIVIDQPWHLWTFLEGAPRLEVLYHSIHYIDTIRWLAGEPRGVYARCVRHPSTPKLRDTRSSIILDYGDGLRCSLVLNHTHRGGPEHRASQMMVEGLRGAALLTWGVNLAYPSGPPDTMEIDGVSIDRGEWTTVPLRGSWFIEAFEGPMSNLQRFVTGEDRVLVSPVSDAIKTMAVVEACYESSEKGGTAIPA